MTLQLRARKGLRREAARSWLSPTTRQRRSHHAGRARIVAKIRHTFPTETPTGFRYPEYEQNSILHFVKFKKRYCFVFVFLLQGTQETNVLI
ncbi:hypothetical protein HPB48_021223 [Haemaphysalis longicornis]|uniref:Uncharacterized protein n=1 Tax=Haemaphysalis longicornis TaxID=44386 RepID=A0A9J6H4W1_HAELO|nr:hypothetical protein HPB48_021223 [Haemaphysalis longicornis]